LETIISDVLPPVFRRKEGLGITRTGWLDVMGEGDTATNRVVHTS